MVEKNLFLHKLSVVSILKNEAHYLKEWLNYHLAAGVDYFYLYDNESSDETREVLQPYIKAGLVSYFIVPGEVAQMPAYNDAVRRFRFATRYMAFIDCDEFIFPKTAQGIGDVVDDVLSKNPQAAGLAINWQIFGSNNLETADYSRGVLERFTRRAPKDWNSVGHGNTHVKTIANPRFIRYIVNPHYAYYFEGIQAVNENGNVVSSAYNNPVTADKIVINHYFTKSHEEFMEKISRGRSDILNKRSEQEFYSHDKNDEFDDGILRYRAERAKVYQLPDKSQAEARLLNALVSNLSPTLLPTTPPQFYAGKMETFLTCRAVAAYLQTRLTNDTPAKFFEEAALNAILRSFAGMSFDAARLLLRELPNLLSLPYPAVKDLRGASLNIIPQLINIMRLNSMWRDYVELNCLQDLLKLI